MIQQIFIPHWRPALDNQLEQSHWRVKAKLKKSDADIVAHYCRHYIKASCKRRLRVEIIHGPRRRDCDPLAPYKSLNDALKVAQMLVDDSPKWLEVGLPLVQRRPKKGEEWGTWISLEDVEDHP